MTAAEQHPPSLGEPNIRRADKDDEFGYEVWSVLCTTCNYEWFGKAWESCTRCIGRLEEEHGRFDEYQALVESAPPPPGIDAPWPNLIPLATEPGYPEFPIDALPPWMAETVKAVAADMQCPPDLPAMLGITVLSVACAKRVKVHVRSTWYEQMGTYLVTALEPGENKSPAVKVMIGPVWDYERHLRESTADARNMAKMRAEYITGERTKKIRAGEMAEAGALTDELNALPPTEPPRLIIDDATPGALVQLMAANGERMAIISSEPAVFAMMKGKFSKDQAADLDVYLKAFSGDSHSEARVTREATPDLVEPALTIGVTVQPSVLAELMTNSELTDRGLLPRFMVSVPKSLVGTRRMDEAVEIDPAVAAAYGRHVSSIIETVSNLTDHVVKMSPGAYRMFTEARQTLEDARRADGPMRPIAAWTIKLESTIARVAGMFAVALHPNHRPDFIDEGHMVSALRIADYWIGHAFASFSLATVDPVENIAKRLSEWLVSSQVKTLTLRDAYKMNRRLTPTSADAVAPLQLLVDRHWLRIDDGTTEVLPGRQGQKGQTFTVSDHVPTQGENLGTLRAHSGVRLTPDDPNLGTLCAHSGEDDPNLGTLCAHSGVQHPPGWGHCEQTPKGVKKETSSSTENDDKPRESAHNVPKSPDPDDQPALTDDDIF